MRTQMVPKNTSQTTDMSSLQERVLEYKEKTEGVIKNKQN